MANYTSSSRKTRFDIRDKSSEIIELYSSGMSSYQIAEKYNVSRSLITSTLKRYGCPMRSGGKLFEKGFTPWNKGKQYAAIMGEKNHRWKGGITSLNQKIRHCIEYKNWIRAVFERDNYTCQKCGKRGGNIEADHFPLTFSSIMEDHGIKSYEDAQRCEVLWKIDNGRALCLKCHNRTKQVRSRFKKLSNKE